MCFTFLCDIGRKEVVAMFIRPAQGKYTSFYGTRTHPVTGAKGKMHWGLDIGNNPANNAIIAPYAGVVSRVQRDGTFGTFGNCIMIKHVINGRSYETVYAHLKSYNVKVGQTVKAGEYIAEKGTTGGSTGIHLHWELHSPVWVNTNKNALDPRLYVIDPEVKEWQILLNKTGMKLVADGVKGNGTNTAIKEFQKSHGLDADGEVGLLTLSKLKEVAFKPTAIISATSLKPVSPTIKQEENVNRMFNPSSTTLRQAVEKEFAQAIKDKIIDAKWLVQLQQGKLSLDDAFALKIIIEQRKNKL